MQSKESSVKALSTQVAAVVSPMRAAGFVCAALACGVAASVLWNGLRYDERPAAVVARTWTVTAGRTARIDAILAPAGTEVRVGTPLVRLKDHSLESKILLLQRELTVLATEAGALEARVAIEVQTRMQQIDQEIFNTKLQNAQLLERRFASEVAEQAWQSAVDDPQTGLESVGLSINPGESLTKDLVAERRMQALIRQGAAQNTKEVCNAQIDLCEERIKSLEAGRKLLAERVRQGLGLTTLHTRQERLEADIAALEQQKGCLTVLADVEGVVGNYARSPGDYVQEQDALVQILSVEKPEVQLLVPSATMMRYPAGKVVDLEFPGRIVRKGKVTELAPQASAIGAAEVLVRLAPTGAQWPKIPVGATVTARCPGAFSL